MSNSWDNVQGAIFLIGRCKKLEYTGKSFAATNDTGAFLNSLPMVAGHKYELKNGDVIEGNVDKVNFT